MRKLLVSEFMTLDGVMQAPGHLLTSSPLPMKIASNIVGIVLVLAGFVWFLQGINVLPGSFMTGKMLWAVLGVLLTVAGIALLVRTNRRPT
jgi:hypothetical protein